MAFSLQTFPKPLTPGEERACLERLQEGDREARDILIERNLRLVAHVAKKYQGTDYEQDDLLSVGTIGLIKAVNTFHPERGSRLATYAAKCIENEILMMFRAGKKYSREVSLFEPIGVDKDGESVSLVDVIELETKEVLENLILDQDIILFGKTVDLIFKFLVFLKYVLLITKTVFYISEHITDTGNALFKGNNQKSGHILQRC